MNVSVITLKDYSMVLFALYTMVYRTGLLSLKWQIKNIFTLIKNIFLDLECKNAGRLYEQVSVHPITTRVSVLLRRNGW